MEDVDALRDALRRIDGSSYGAYKRLQGAWRLRPDLVLHIDRVQGDPFAAPSRVRLVRAGALDPAYAADADTRLAAEDWLLRRVNGALDWTRRGSGSSGRVTVYAPGPEVVERSAVRLHRDGTAELRCAVGLPARGRRILGREAFALFDEDLPRLATAMTWAEELDRGVASVRQQRWLRRALPEHGLVAFLADGSVLPRASGVETGPLPGATPLHAPEALAVTLETPWGPVRGLGLPQGVTVITGGGFHGKSTVLAALASGVRDHIPGDGRERVVSDPHTVKIRAEDGRSVRGVDISAFLRTLPGTRDPSCFSTDDASGSTSQAAALVEAVEAGATVVLLDEDTSATNLLVRDAAMRALIPDTAEPIVPFVDRVEQVHEDWGVSTVMVVGGVGDYLGVADTVLGMQDFCPHDWTEAAHELAAVPVGPPGPLPELPQRVPGRAGLAVERVRARDQRAVDLDKVELDLTAVDGVLDGRVAETLGHALRFAGEELVDGRRSLARVLDALDAVLDDEGIEALSPWSAPGGGLVRPRRHEVAAALNRWRGLRIV